jgi:hypothetical protein
MTRQRFVDGVVDDLGNQMMKSALGGVADIHAGAFADRLETFENPDRLGAVTVGTLFVWHRKRTELNLTSQPLPTAFSLYAVRRAE